jgi:hypothetical protein
MRGKNVKNLSEEHSYIGDTEVRHYVEIVIFHKVTCTDPPDALEVLTESTRVQVRRHD